MAFRRARSQALLLLVGTTLFVLACQTQAARGWQSSSWRVLQTIRGGALPAAGGAPVWPPLSNTATTRGGSSIKQQQQRRRGRRLYMTATQQQQQQQQDASTTSTDAVSSSLSSSTTSDITSDGDEASDTTTTSIVNAATSSSLSESNHKEAKDTTNNNKTDRIMFAVYFCNCVGSSLPIILLPLIAAEQAAVMAATGAAAAGSFNNAAFCASVASMAALGGGVGKLVNGFLCQAVGGRTLAAVYLLGMTATTTLLSTGSTALSTVGWTLAGLEFFVSAMWPACSLVLSNHFGHHPGRFAEAITVLSLASTAGTLWGKLGGTAVLPFVPSWRVAARCGAVLTLVGSLLMMGLVSEHPTTTPSSDAAVTNPKQPQQQVAVASGNKSGLFSGVHQITATLRTVMGSRLFWLAGLAHGTTYLVRTSDRVLGALFQDATALPKTLCGLLTAAVTLGFVHGLAGGKAQRFAALPSPAHQSAVLKRHYGRSVVFTAAMGLFCFTPFAARVVPSQYVRAAILALLSGGMASSLAFQFYQIPPQVAHSFGESKAVCLSFLDAMGFFMSAIAWSVTGKIVSALGGSNGGLGWSTTCLLLSVLFGGGGLLMSHLYPQIVHAQQQQQNQPKPVTA